MVIEKGVYHGVEAVIDKDLTAAILATEVQADVLAIITGVRAVYLNYREPNQEELRRLDLARVETLINENQFAEGSMLPKIRAAMQFLRQRGDRTARAVITDWSDLPAALDGTTGTTITL